MKESNFRMICGCLIILSLVAGITACAIYFNRPAILWWYLVPAFMGWDLM